MSFKINYTIPSMTDTSVLAGVVNSSNVVNNILSFTGPTGAAGSGFTGPTGAAGSGFTGPTGAAGLSVPKFITRFTPSGPIPAISNIYYGQLSLNENDSSIIVPGTFSGNPTDGITFTFTVGGTYDIIITFTILSTLADTSFESLLQIMNGGSVFYQGYPMALGGTLGVGDRATFSQRVIVKDIVAGYTMFVSYTSSGSITLNSGGTMTILQVGE